MPRKSGKQNSQNLLTLVDWYKIGDRGYVATRVDTTIDYNRMFDSEIIIDFNLLIGEVLRRLANGNRLSQ